jgi:hypothetical protein
MNIPKEIPQGFFSLLSVGNSGSGKTNATLNLIQKLKPYYNVHILISPTGCFDEEKAKSLFFFHIKIFLFNHMRLEYCAAYPPPPISVSNQIWVSHRPSEKGASRRPIDYVWVV